MSTLRSGHADQSFAFPDVAALLPHSRFSSIRQAEEVARREGTTVDSIISIALSSQVSAWKVRDTFEQRAARGNTADLAEILAEVPDAPPAPGDERE